MHSQRALELYDELGRLGPQATIYNNLGMFAYYEARWDDAVELFEKARQLRLRLGDEVDAALGTFNIGEVRSDQGRLDEARPLFEEAGRVWRAAEYSCGVAMRRRQPRHGRQPLRASSSWRASCSTRPASSSHALVSEHDLIDTDARIAESLVLQGRDRGRARARRRLSGADGGARWRHSRPDAPPHPRVCVGTARRAGAAGAELDRSLEIARARDARYEIALAQDAIARIGERIGAPDPAEARAEADRLFRMLEVVSIAEVPLDATLATRSLS